MGMYLIQYHVFRKRALAPTDTKVSDFDGVEYQVLINGNNPHILELNMFMKDYASVSRAGADKALASIYGEYQGNSSSPERPDVTLHLDASKVHEKRIDEIADLFALLKRNLLAAPLRTAFEGLQNGSSGSLKPSVFNIRDNEQTVILPKSDRVVYAVSFTLTEDTDASFAEQILDKMAGASKSSNGPNVKFTRDVPADISSVNGVKLEQNSIGFLLFSISKAQVNKSNMENVLDLLLDVRHYVHYHIKASKAHLHQRMRAKVKYFLQVLNRAQPEKKKEKKKYRTIV